MQLEHINLFVEDINKSLQFYKAAFPHWHIRSKGSATWYGKDRNWLHFGNDYHYLAFNEKAYGQNRDLTSMHVGLAHFAYTTNNIDALIKRMQEAGFQISNPGAAHEYRKNVYFLDPDGFEVEFVEYLSDMPAQRNS